MFSLLLLAAGVGPVGPVAATTIPATRVPAVAAVERLELGVLRRPVELFVDPLGLRIELRTVEAAALAARLHPAAGGTCPVVELVASAVVLRCRTPRFEAELGASGGRRVLDIRALQGLPSRGPDQELDVFYDPVSLRLGAPCPGTTPGVRGECALAASRPDEAQLQFRLALETPLSAWAALRLGDLALRAGDVSTALSWYLRVGTSGAFGRMAAAHVCEITGACLDDRRSSLFETAGLPLPVASELMLRGARAAAFAGRTKEALRRLEIVQEAGASLGVCDRVGQRFCRRLLLDVLERSDGETGLRALGAYLSLPRRTDGPLSVELARAAAERAATLGAPVFGGNVLASVFASVRPEQMPEHLLRVVELYLRGRDTARARIVLDYAETRLSPRQMASARWRAAHEGVRSERDDGAPATASTEGAPFDELATLVARDVAAAFGIMARARAAAP